jgi:hypothetical protein
MVSLSSFIGDEEMKTKIMGIITVALVLGFGGIAKADIVELDLFSLGCPTEFDFWDPPYWWTGDFDLGVTFTEISNVYIDWSGEITGGLAILLDPVTFKPIGEPFPIEAGVYASLGFNPYLRRTTVWGGRVTYPDPEPFDCRSEFDLVGSSTWSDLLDGKGAITIGYTELTIFNGRNVEHGSITLDSATLVVDGVVVPEPASILLLVMGVLLQRRLK